MKLQFPIKWLLAAVGFCGVAFAALRSASGWCASGVFSATLLGLSLAIAYGVHRRGPRRAFWATSAAFGWGYMLLAFGPVCESSIRPRLLTTKLLDAFSPTVDPAHDRTVWLWDAPEPEPLYTVALSPQGGKEEGKAAGHGISVAVRRHYQDIGHSLASLLVAAIGGVAARHFHADGDESPRRLRA